MLIFIYILYSDYYCDCLELNGNGATFPRPVYQDWLTAFIANRSSFVTLSGKYDTSGTGTGIKMIMDARSNNIVFSGTDINLPNETLYKYPNLQSVPTLAGAIIVAHNIPEYFGFNGLTMSRDLLAKIFMGNVTNWNNSDIQKINPGKVFPNADINVVVREEDSGTTYKFTSALASFSSEFKTRYGVFSDSTGWNKSVVKLYGLTTNTVAGITRAVKYSISYITEAELHYYNLSSFRIINKRNQTVNATVEAVQAAMNAQSQISNDEKFNNDMIDLDSDYSYPISTFTYMVIYLYGFWSCDLMVEMYRFLEWIITNTAADEIAMKYKMVPLSNAFKSLVYNQILLKITCENDSKSVKGLVDIQKAKENAANNLIDKMLKITLPILSVLILVVISIGSFMFYKQQKDIIYNVWKIPYDLLENNTSQSNILRALSHLSLNSNTGDKKVDILFKAYENNNVFITNTYLGQSRATFSWKTRSTLNKFRSLNYNNVCTFIGITFHDDRLWLVTENCSKGSLYNILHNSGVTLSDSVKFSLASDISLGMEYLHRQQIIHGHLSSFSCFLDKKWNVKIADWSLNHLFFACKIKDPLKETKTPTNNNTNNKIGPTSRDYDTVALKSLNRHRLWQAPEIILHENFLEISNMKTDVYSFGIILIEIWNREIPFQEELHKGESLDDIVNTVSTKHIIPYISFSMSPPVKIIALQCVNSDSYLRPTFTSVRKSLKVANPSKKSVLDSMIDALDSYILNLEDMVQTRTKEVEDSQKKMKNLLYQMLPASVVEKLTKKEPVIPEFYESVSLYFSDIVGFTSTSSKCTPMQVVDMLNGLYSLFDSIVEKNDVYKVETIGDAYFVSSGVPNRNGKQHLIEICEFALGIVDSVANVYRLPHNGQPIAVRIGIHTGSVVAGVVGNKMPRFCLFGDTVNTASRMESTGVAMKIQASEIAYKLMNEHNMYRFSCRGQIEVKGKGSQTTYFLEGRKT